MGRKVKNNETGNLVMKQCECGREERVDEACEKVVCYACALKNTFPQGEIDRVNDKKVTKKSTGRRGRPKGSKTKVSKKSAPNPKTVRAGKRGRKTSEVGLAVMQYFDENRGKVVKDTELLPVYVAARKVMGKYSGDEVTELRNLSSTLYMAAKSGKVVKVSKHEYKVD